ALRHKNSFISDYNPELTNLYKVIKEKPIELIEDLKKHKNDEEYYYAIRSLDRDAAHYAKLTDVQKASRFIYLNKTGYNGLYRVNQKGQNNVPFGRYKNPKWLDEENILACSELLAHTEIQTGILQRKIVTLFRMVGISPLFEKLTQRDRIISNKILSFKIESVCPAPPFRRIEKVQYFCFQCRTRHQKQNKEFVNFTEATQTNRLCTSQQVHRFALLSYR
ncbi:MAG: hypothetical protein DSZ05_02060, partial [Sulfurospirillum sp.]